MTNIDILFINTNVSKKVYQDLSDKWIAIEPPTWSLLLAQSCRSKGYEVGILDANAERLSLEETAQKILDIKPKYACFVSYGQNPNSSTSNMVGVYDIAQIIKENSDIKTISVGNHTAALPNEVLGNEYIDFICINEGVYTIWGLLEGKDIKSIAGLGWKENRINNINNGAGSLVPTSRMDIDLPGYAFDLLPYKNKPLDLYQAHWWHAEFQEKYRNPFVSLYSSLGCQFKCLSGDTPINTIYGKIPIKTLSEKYNTIPVYTYDQNTKKLIIKDAINIKKIASNQQLVRVIFDNGEHIDCTPDHKFLCFKTGNQYTKYQEYVEEAQNLKPKTRLRAYGEYLYPNKYRQLVCRTTNYYNARLVLEYKLGRKLKNKEEVHHKDKNRINDHPDNLELCSNRTEHLKLHPNPQEHWTPNTTKIISEKIKKYRNKPEIREKYRQQNLGVNNPNYKHGRRCGTTSRIKEINHKVKEVIWLDKKEDVYCLTVPNNGWFFANNVLVKNCNFCIINTINRTNPREGITAADSNIMRFWSPEFIMNQFDELVNKYGVNTIRLADEMFFLNKKYYEPLLLSLKERGYGKHLKMWSYARVDTVNERFLDTFREGGVRWLALGIEAANQEIRKEIYKGKFQDINIRDVVKQIKDHDMYVVGNYIFGHSEEKMEHMQETLNLALELNCEFPNLYAAMALPGSPLYYEAKKNGWKLPDSPEGFAFHSYECLPTGTKYLTPAEVLKFRDEAWHKCFTEPKYLELVEQKFGLEAKTNLHEMAKIKLKRKILGD